MAKKQDYCRMILVSRGEMTQIWVKEVEISSILKSLYKRFGKRVYDHRPTYAVRAGKWVKPVPQLVKAP